MEPEAMDEFERELRQAFERRPAPPSLKSKLMERRRAERELRFRRRAVLWERLAASLLLTGVLGGAVAWHRAEQQRKGEEARQQVFTALRIASRALNQMNAQLAARNRGAQE